MNEEGREFSGRSVDEAIAAALQTLKLRSNQVHIEVINKGSRGLLGIGSTPALIRVTPIQSAEVSSNRVVEEKTPVAEMRAVETSPAEPTPLAPIQPSTPPHEENASVIGEAVTAPHDIDEDNQAPLHDVTPTEADAESSDESDEESAEVDDEEGTQAAAVEILSTMVQLMGFKVTVEPVWKEGDDEHDKRVLWLEIHGSNLSSLIGRRGETLENIQYLLRMMVNQRLHRWNDIVVDVDQYRTRRAEQISQLAQRLADQALSAGRAMALEPMPPNERRIVHMALRNHPHVYTQSSGEGERRKVYIVPKS